MILKLYAVRDRQADAFNLPQFLNAPGQAIRAFSDEINRSAADNQLYAHPDDFDLWYLADFDTSSGHFSSSPQQICIGKNVKLNGST